MKVILFFLTTLCIFVSAQEKGAKPSIAVVDFLGRGVSTEEALTLSDRFAAELLASGRFQVLERARVNELMKEQAFQQTYCSDPECAVQVGKLIAVRKIVMGTVAKVGGIYTVNIKMVDVENGKVEKALAEDCDCGIEEVLTGVLGRMASKMAGVERLGEGAIVSLEKGDASIFVKSAPDSARVLVDGKIIEGVTPVTVQGLPSGRHDIRVQKGDLAATAIVTLKPRKIKRLNLSLKKQKTALKVISTPSEAEVYLNARPNRSQWPDQVSPAVFEGIKAESLNVTLFKPGYFDTTFSVTLIKNRENTVNVSLNAADSSYLKLQKHFVVQRGQRRLGFRLGIASAVLLAGGIVAVIAAQKDYDDALAAKEMLDLSVIKAGPDYQAALDENKTKNDAGNFKSTLGLIGFGAAAAALSAGIVLYF